MRIPINTVSPFFYYPIIILIISSAIDLLEVSSQKFATSIQVLPARYSATNFSSYVAGKPASHQIKYWNKAIFQIP
jgi:hypothetical protein